MFVVRRCPELNACISSLFWCDGVPHCPMGFDEDPVNCADRNGMSLVYVGVLGGTAVMLFTVTVTAAVMCLRCKARNRGGGRAADGRRHAAGPQQKASSGTVAGDAAGIDRTMHFVDKRFLDQNGGMAAGDPLGKRYPSTSDDLYLECKDSVC